MSVICSSAGGSPPGKSISGLVMLILVLSLVAHKRRRGAGLRASRLPIPPGSICTLLPPSPSRRHCRSTVSLWPAGVPKFGAGQAVSGHDGHARGEGQHRGLRREVLQEQAA